MDAGRRREGVQAPSNAPVRADVPGALDHASGDVDEFDAALVRGAGGVPATPANDPDGSALDELQDDDALLPGASGSGGSGAGSGGTGAAGEAGAPSGAPLRGGNRALGFIRASWAELQRVHWPDRRQVSQATAVVLGFVAIAGAYLGLADYVAKEIVEFVL
ncbi:MAG TPA: preprotein translocase subunit SecE [Solirubrobacteraceae bacterium]